MSNTIPGLLNDTLNLIQLARETALAQGKQTQASRLTPVVEDLRNVVNTSREQPASSSPTGVMAQDDFRTLLNVSKVSSMPVKSGSVQSSMERNQMVVAMSAGHMSELDIARQLGMTREEVHTVISIHQKSQNNLRGV
ncbi:MAG: hypothetical protein GYA17_05020 [Chloroflexi bacterium]|nr:hypothetical protein [Anaerolineaceae bacterium]NMB87696.1 hypothetical protein [Chloroflexota bacterium]